MFNRRFSAQSLVETVLALAIFLVFLTGALTLSFRYLDANAKTQEYQDVQTIAAEGLEAVQSIGYNNWPALVNGDYGLTAAGGSWQLQGSPDLVKNKYTRAVTIAGVNRDAACQVVASGGNEDPDTKLVTVSVAWTARGQNLNRSYAKQLTNWKSPVLACGAASNLEINVAGAFIDSTKKNLLGAFLVNNGSTPITLDKMTLTWTTEGEIKEIKIAGVIRWHATNGTGSPQGEQPSGTELDIVNVTLDPSIHYNLIFRFDEKIDGATVTIKATMTDGSSTTEITSPPFVP